MSAAVYQTFEDAQKRVDAIKKNFRWWPGIVCRRDGTYTLTYDPQDGDPQS